ncbi:lipopolysaccharide biosynthesis protein [Pelagicoccus sp. SDUM812002]|nr:lipopolysaccharide biosynthesis protein [Pelagicoccus sp. SDUM812002]
MVDTSGESEKRSKQTRHFDTDHLRADLKGRSVRSGTVTMVSQGLRFVINMGSTMVLARLLAPEDFGLIAMTQSILVFVNIFQSMGLSVATVQREHITHEQVSTLYWINCAASTCVGILTIAIAPLVALLYGEPRLTAVTMALSVPMIISGFGSQHGALLTRQMRFGTEQVVILFAMIVSIIVAVVFAKLGHGYWALVYKEIAMTSTIVVCFWLSVRWIPGLPRKGTGVSGMLKFGAFLTGSSFVNQMARNVDNILIGAFAGPVALGLYSKAYNLLLMPIRQINMPIGRVAIPSLSRLQNEPQRFAGFYYKGVEMLVFCGMPIVTFCFVAAEDIVMVVLGEQWTDTVGIFRALAPAAILGTFSVAAGWLFHPLGRTKKELYVTLVSSTLTIAAFAIGIRWGAMGVAYAYSAACVLKTVPELSYATKDSPVSLSATLLIPFRPFLACLASGGALWLAKPLLIPIKSDLLAIIINLVAFLVCYLVSILIIPGGRSFLYSSKNTLIESFLKKKK